MSERAWAWRFAAMSAGNQALFAASLHWLFAAMALVFAAFCGLAWGRSQTEGGK
jgi:hypothetical protein